MSAVAPPARHSSSKHVALRHGVLTLMIVLVGALVTSACTSDSADQQSVPEQATGESDAGESDTAAAPDPDPVVTPQPSPADGLDLDATTLADGPVDAATKQQVTEWFDHFLELRGRYYLGEASLQDIAAYTSDRALLAELPELQDAYVQLLDDELIIATKEFASFSNPSNMVAIRGQITFDDCTEQQALSILDIVGFRWITQRVTLASVDGGWSIVAIDIVHDGEPWTEPYGCAPDSFEGRALEITEQLMQENRRYQQDPSQFDADAFAYFEEPQMRDLFVGAVVEQQAQGITVVSPEEWRYEVLGLDVGASLLGWAVAIDVCSHRPEGVLYTVDGSDEILTDTTVDPGFSLQYRVTTMLEQVADGVAPLDQIFAVEIVGDECW